MTIKKKIKHNVRTKVEIKEANVNFSPNKIKAKKKLLKTRKTFSFPKNHNYDELFND